MFVTDNETAIRLQERGLARRADAAPAIQVQPSASVLDMIRALREKMARPVETAAVPVPENKAIVVPENKTLKRKRGRPPGSRNKNYGPTK